MEMPKVCFIVSSQKLPGRIETTHGKTSTKWSVSGQMRNITKQQSQGKTKEMEVGKEDGEEVEFVCYLIMLSIAKITYGISDR
jgi:hypothetical protein